MAGMQQLIVDQHLELATLVGTVRKAHAAGATWEEMAAHFDEAIAKVSAHFEREELDMTLITYPHLVEHRTNHETFLRRLRLLRSECDRRESELMAVFMDMLENWLKNHERTADDLLLRYMAGHR